MLECALSYFLERKCALCLVSLDLSGTILSQSQQNLSWISLVNLAFLKLSSLNQGKNIGLHHTENIAGSLKLFLFSFSGLVITSCFFFVYKQKQDELLLEDIWTLLRAGRLEEASELCRSAGQVDQLIQTIVLIMCCLYLFCDALTLEYIFRHGELPHFVLLVAQICFLPWMHCSRMASPEHYKQLNWKVVLDGSGVFGNGHHIVLQR